MEWKETIRGLLLLIQMALLLSQIRKWEREMRRANRAYEFCRAETARKRLADLHEAVESLKAEMTGEPA